MAFFKYYHQITVKKMDNYYTLGILSIFFSILLSLSIHIYATKNSYKTIPKFTHVCIFISIVICILPIFMLSIDIDATAIAIINKTQVSYVFWLYDWWYSIFVITQIMTWIFLPTLQVYDCAGEFTTIEKIKASIAENIKWYIIFGVIFIMIISIMIIMKGIKSFHGVILLCIAMSNTIGMILLVIFLSYGLAELPKKLYYLSNTKKNLDENFTKISQNFEKFTDAKFKLDEILTTLSNMLTSLTNNEEKIVINALINSCTNTIKYVSNLTIEKSHIVNDSNINVTTIYIPYNTENSLIKIHYDLKKNTKIVHRSYYNYSKAIKDNLLNNNDKYKYIFVMLSIITGILSIVIFWSELVVPLQNYNIDISIIEILIKKTSIRYFWILLFVFYMCGVSYWAFFQIDMFDTYTLIPKISDAETLCFSFAFLTKFVLPLCYNFIWITNVTQEKTLIYIQFFGHLDVAEFLGQWFKTLIPVLIPILALLFHFDFFKNLYLWFGTKNNMTQEEIVRHIIKGKEILNREIDISLKKIEI
jgi:hypothetical protein